MDVFPFGPLIAAQLLFFDVFIDAERPVVCEAFHLHDLAVHHQGGKMFLAPLVDIFFYEIFDIRTPVHDFPADPDEWGMRSPETAIFP